MALIGLIIIAVALLVLGVPGIRWKLPVPTASRRAGPGSARIAGR
jgi:cytosine/uracil/thiamine/allantoin permease